jgi:hypothetical protein
LREAEDFFELRVDNGTSFVVQEADLFVDDEDHATLGRFTH